MYLKVAGQFGGGGHQKASGCNLTEEAYKLFVLDTFHLSSIPEDAKRNQYNLKQSSFGSFYKNRNNETFILYSKNDQDWILEKDKMELEQTFTSFEEGERFLKRNYEAALVRDDLFVDYLMSEVKKRENLDS